ncbi:MAG: NAD(P)/FAD-dependent oxidoreductase [Bacteroidota bacterium]
MGTRSVNTITADIAIIGAGPAGSSCALSLKDSGVSVLLIDKAYFPRDKICGDALSGKVVSGLKSMIPDIRAKLTNFEEARDAWGIRFFSPSTHSLDVPFKRNPSLKKEESPSFVLPRYAFDHLLFSAVSSCPDIRVLQGHRLTHLTRTAAGWQLDTHQGRLQAKLLIDASGATSLLARQTYPFKSSPKHLSVGLRQYIQGIEGCHEQGYLELHYLPSVMPGYAWIFPMGNGKANVGIGMLSSDLHKKEDTLDQIYEQFLMHPSICERMTQATPLERPKGWSLPFGSLKRKISGDYYLMTGDAAGLIDPFTGEGIANAILSGKLAAQKAMECFQADDFSSTFMESYDETLFSNIGAELKLSHQLQQVGRYPFLLNILIKKAARNPAIQDLFTSMFEEIDIRKTLSKPSFYVNLLFK